MAEPGARPEGIPGSRAHRARSRSAHYAAQLRDRLRGFARVQLFGEVVGFEAGRAKVWFELRDGAGALPCSMWRDEFERARRSARWPTARRSWSAGRLRLLPGLAHRLAVVLASRSSDAARGRRGRPARPARAAAQRAAAEGAVRAAEARCAARRCRATIGVVTRRAAARRATTCWPGCAGAAGRGRLVWAFAPGAGPPRRPGDHARAAGPRGVRGGRRDRRRPRRRLARRPVRVLRRDAVPHGRAAARCR